MHFNFYHWEISWGKIQHFCRLLWHITRWIHFTTLERQKCSIWKVNNRIKTFEHNNKLYSNTLSGVANFLTTRMSVFRYDEYRAGYSGNNQCKNKCNVVFHIADILLKISYNIIMWTFSGLIYSVHLHDILTFYTVFICMVFSELIQSLHLYNNLNFSPWLARNSFLLSVAIDLPTLGTCGNWPADFGLVSKNFAAILTLCVWVANEITEINELILLLWI